MPATAITPVMERLLYALSSIKRPQSFIAIGIYCGNTLVWSAGSSCGKGEIYGSKRIYGIDIDKKSIKLAIANFSKLKNIFVTITKVFIAIDWLIMTYAEASF